MAILTPQQKRLRIFVYVFGALLLITAAVVYFGFFRKPTAPTLSPKLTPLTTASSAEEIKRIKIDWVFLEGQIFQDLKFFGEHPVEPGDKGRSNPFLPI